MKTSLIHSANIGLIAMIIVALTDGVIGTLIASGEPGRESLINLAYFFWLPVPIGLPLLAATMVWITWRQTGDLLINLNTKEAKKQLMISVWVSTAIATLPFLLVTLFLFVATVMIPGSSAELGMGQFFSILCLFVNLSLIVVVGLLARLFVPKEKADTS